MLSHNENEEGQAENTKMGDLYSSLSSWQPLFTNIWSSGWNDSEMAKSFYVYMLRR